MKTIFIYTFKIVKTKLTINKGLFRNGCAVIRQAKSRS